MRFLTSAHPMFLACFDRPNIALHPARARKRLCIFRFCAGRGRVSCTLYYSMNRAKVIRDIESAFDNVVLENGIGILEGPAKRK